MNFKEMLLNAPQVGTFVKIPSIDVVDILAMSGFDFIVIDMEHSPLSLLDAKHLCAAAQAAGLKVLVRPYENSRSLVLRILDLGVDGLQVPMIENRDQAQELVDFCLYPPMGRRGFALSHRAGRFGFNDAERYIDSCNEDIFIAAQLETGTALENADDICSVGRLDMVFMGPADLSVSLGVSNDYINGGLVEPFDKIIETSKMHGKLVGTHVNSPEKLKHCLSKGMNYILWDYDLGMLKKQTESDIKTIKSLINEED